MHLNLKVEWIRKLKNERIVEAHNWRSPERWEMVDIEALEEADLDQLLDLMAEQRGAKGSLAVVQKINTYRKLSTNVKGTKITRLEPLVLAVKKLLEPTPHKWLFTENKDGHLIPWYVHSVSYLPPEPRRGLPASTSVDLAAVKRGSKVTDSIRFHATELGDTAYNLLAREGYFVETPEIVEAYSSENQRYQAVCGLTGTQFLASGDSFALSSRWDRELTAMERDGAPTRVVMDDESEEEETKENNTRITTQFWTENKKSDDNESSENSVVDLPVQPYVKVFDLDKHNFISLHVANLTEYVYDAAMIHKLVLSEERKELLSMLVEGADTVMEDIVKGKTGGIIVICTGPPGTGKTLSAEVFSEQVKRPLYAVQCSQLGTDAKDLEKELRTVLSRAQRWKAILLIDEADVYVHERGSDIQQNAIVGVFLRILEHYRGVLFMTSNRETIIDDAIMSRATAWIRYDLPGTEQLRAIWTVLSAQYAARLTPEAIERLTACEKFKRISGRSVKNLLKLARLLSARKQQPITVESLLYVSQFLDLEQLDK